MGWSVIINVLEFSVEGIFNHIVLFFCRGVSTNKADSIEFALMRIVAIFAKSLN